MAASMAAQAGGILRLKSALPTLNTKLVPLGQNVALSANFSPEVAKANVLSHRVRSSQQNGYGRVRALETSTSATAAASSATLTTGDERTKRMRSDGEQHRGLDEGRSTSSCAGRPDFIVE